MIVLPGHSLPGLSFLPESGILLAFTLACLVLFITPGPDMSLFLSRTLQGGRRAGIASMLGACAGCCVHTAAASLGLSALIAASATAFTLMKIVGALYLAWLAIQAVREGSALSLKDGPSRPVSFRRTFLLGLSVNLTNPKVVLFFVTFLPQFVAADDPHAPGKMLFLGLYFVAVSAPLAVLMILGAERMIAALKRNPRVLRGIDYLFAGVFGLFAIRILATQAR